MFVKMSEMMSGLTETILEHGCTGKIQLWTFLLVSETGTTIISVEIQGDYWLVMCCHILWWPLLCVSKSLILVSVSKVKIKLFLSNFMANTLLLLTQLWLVKPCISLDKKNWNTDPLFPGVVLSLARSAVRLSAGQTGVMNKIIDALHCQDDTDSIAPCLMYMRTKVIISHEDLLKMYELPFSSRYNW